MAIKRPPNGGIIIVDGDQSYQAALQADMEKNGFEVFFAETVNRLFTLMETKFDKFKPTMVVVDTILPQMSGFEVVRRFVDKYADKKIPVLMTSKYKSEEDTLEIHNAGAKGLLEKPLTAQTFRHVIEREKIKKMKGEIGDMVFDINYE